jgi:hypothetical protein
VYEVNEAERGNILGNVEKGAGVVDHGNGSLGIHGWYTDG